MTVALAALVSVAVCAAARLIPGLVWPRHAMDGGYHMLLRREIRRNRFRMPARVAAMALDERQTYPWWYHSFLALLPEAWLRRVPPLPSTLIDAAHTVIVVLLAAHLAPFAGPAVDPAVAGLVAGIVFAISPALLVVGIGPRAYEITPRPLGELCYTVLMAAGAAYATGGSPWYVAVAAVAGAILLMSSKFAAQVLVFCAPAVALAAGSWIPVLLVPLAFLACFILTGGRYWWVLVGQVRHLDIFRRRLQHEHAILRDRNRWRALLDAAVAVLRSPGRTTARIELMRLAEHNTVLQFLLRNVLWLAVVGLILTGVFVPWAPGGEGWRAWLIGWTLAPLVPFVLSSMRSLRFLGEAERYPEYAVAPVAVLFAVGALSLSAPAGVLLIAGYFLSLVPPAAYSYARQRWNASRTTGGMDELLGFLETQPAGTVVLPVPWFAAYVLAPELDHRFLAGNDTIVWHRDYDRIFSRYPWPTPDLGYWRTRQAELMLVEWKLLATDRTAPAYPVDTLPVIYSDDRFRIYRLRSSS